MKRRKIKLKKFCKFMAYKLRAKKVPSGYEVRLEKVGYKINFRKKGSSKYKNLSGSGKTKYDAFKNLVKRLNRCVGCRLSNKYDTIRFVLPRFK